ncbi:MAG: hypothetical protein A2W19_06375 [Spirochaetes bacterium RBG_16_49_21]|nr:MAG: hypothetical protein A2W19_06375 [Spirochaetes bacterium RBG_16_49_21]
MNAKSIIIIVLVVLITILSMQNTQSVVVNMLFWQATYPLIILMYILLGIGFAAGYLARSVFKIFKKNKSSNDY